MTFFLRFGLIFSVLFIDTCQETETIEDSYMDIPIEVKKTNYDKDIPFINYSKYLEANSKNNLASEDFIIVDYKGVLLSVSSHEDPIRFDKYSPGSWELLKLIRLENEKVAFLDYKNRYMTLHQDQSIRFTEHSIEKKNEFKLIPLQNDQYAIVASNDSYLSSENGFKGITANRVRAGEWETFTIFKLLPPK